MFWNNRKFKKNWRSSYEKSTLRLDQFMMPETKEKRNSYRNYRS